MGRYSTIWKSTLREIRQSFGRFAAIMAIVALGVGLFAGLKLTRTAMTDLVQRYFEDQNFYDYRLLSTYGFGQEDVDFLRGEAGGVKESIAEAVEGTLSFDVLYRDEAGEEGVLKLYSLTESVNSVLVLEGRMPREPEECVVDADLFGPEALGGRLILSENNEKETLEHFTRREYTIVGRVQSPLYIQFERGNTSLGTGRIDGFAYLLPEGFAEDYYTELYVKFYEDMPLYSEAYKEFLQERDVIWEDLTAQAAQKRFGRLLTDAEAEYADALEEFEAEKADAEAELADAGRKLEDAAVELADGEREIRDAKEKLSDGEAELADARQTVTDKEKELADGERELADARDEWNAQNDAVESAKMDMAAAERELKEQETMLAQKEKELAEGETLLAAAMSQYHIENIDMARAGLDQAQARLTALKALASVSGGDLPGGGGQLTEQIALLESTVEGLTSLIAGYEEIQEGKAALAAGRAQLQAGREQILSAVGTLESADGELARAWMEMADAERELADGKKALADARTELSDGEADLADARAELADGERELADARQEYADGLAEYEDGLAEFEAEIADAQRELADARKEIDDMEAPDTYVLGRDTNVGYLCFESDSGIVDGIANVFPVFFFLVAALVCITTMNRMVEEQRTQIGVLKALGYGDAAIMMKYIFYSGSAAVLGCVLGFFSGTYIFPKVIWRAYCIMYSVGEIRYIFDWRLAVISLAVSLLCSVGTTWLSCRVELSEVAAQLMRPKAPKAGKRVFLEYLPFLWRRLTFLRKVSARNIFRYKKRLFMMILGISGCTALLVTGFGIRDSIAEVADQQFQEIQIYDLSLTLADGLDEEMEERIDEAAGQGTGASMIAGRIKLSEKSMDIVTADNRKSSYVVVVEDGAEISPFLNLHSLKNEKIAYPGPGEAVVSHKIADELGIRPGDTIVLENDDLREIRAVVAGISENFIYNYVYLSESVYRECMGELPEYNSLYLNAAEGTDVHRLSAALMGVDGVSNVTVNSDVLARFNNMMESLNLIVAAVILCAALLAFVVLYNLTNINITERVREIATIKVLGFYKKETASYVFRENMVLTLLGAALGLFLGKWLHGFVMSQIRVDMIAFDVRILPQSYGYSLIFTFLFAWFVDRIMGRKLEKISMTESLKSVD